MRGICRSGSAGLAGGRTERGGTAFDGGPPARQTGRLEVLAFRRNETPELAPGIQFFAWVRRMTVDAFYTSEIGIKDIDYRGNAPMASYPSPAEAIEYALKRSGL